MEAFIDNKAFAIGLDIKPTKKNKWVVVGDFHHIQYANESVDIVYTNSLDHVLDMEQVFSEIHRVLKHPGYFVLEIPRGSDEGKEPNFWEGTWWKKIADVTLLVEKAGFSWLCQSPYAAKKETICFSKSNG